MLRATACLGVVFAWSSPASAQNEIFYYRFDETGGGKSINYAAGTGRAPAEGTVVTTDTTAWAAGRFGPSGLRGSGTGGTAFYSLVETGGHSGISGDFTVAWFMKERTPYASTSGVKYFFGSNTSGSLFRGYTGGAQAGTFLLVRNWGGAPSDLRSTTDIFTGAQGAWLHIALVVDATAGTATFYANGIPETPIPVSGSASVPAMTTFRLNAYTLTAGNSFYDMDEFRLLARAATPTEILNWTLGASPGHAAFGRGCGGTLSATGGPPALGTPGYTLRLAAAAGAPYFLAVGGSRVAFGPVPLPLDLGSVLPSLVGCSWETSISFAFGGVLDGSGNGSQALPIPNDPSLDGAVVYAQTLFLAPGQEQSSNPFAIGLGR